MHLSSGGKSFGNGLGDGLGDGFGNDIPSLFHNFTVFGDGLDFIGGGDRVLLRLLALSLLLFVHTVFKGEISGFSFCEAISSYFLACCRNAVCN